MIEHVILDSGALGAFAEGDLRMRAVMTRFMRGGTPIEIPTVVIAECLRSNAHNDAKYHRVLKALGGIERVTVPLTSAIARAAGRLLNVTARKATIDAIVVATAERHTTATVITGDSDDIENLAFHATTEVGVILLTEIRT